MGYFSTIEVFVKIEEGKVKVTPPSDSKQDRAFHGLYRSLINNMVIGVTNGYQKDLEIQGVGYRAELSGKSISFSEVLK